MAQNRSGAARGGAGATRLAAGEKPRGPPLTAPARLRFTEPRGSDARRTRLLSRRLQRLLERFYQIEQTPDVRAFVREVAKGGREELLLREHDDELEIALLVPPRSEQGADAWLQVAEGISHFVYVTNRARMELPATRLELELQAEVDKFVLLGPGEGTLEPGRALSLHAWLFENVRFLHAEGTELGERYRVANDLAARFVRRLLRRDVATSHFELRRFYRAGLAEKVWLAAA